MKRKFKQWCDVNNSTNIIKKSTQTRHVKLEVRIMARDRYKNVTVLNRFIICEIASAMHRQNRRYQDMINKSCIILKDKALAMNNVKT